MGLRLIFDHSAMCMINWHKQFSPNFKSELGSEAGDFGRMLALAYYEMVIRFNPSEIVFALDSKPYWRNFYYAHEYATESCRIYKHKTDIDHYILDMDRALYQVKRHDMTGNWQVIKHTLTQAQKAGINVDIMNEAEAEYTRIQLGDIKDPQAHDAVLGQIPSYKGTRTKQIWKARTPKEEAQKMFRAIAHNFAPLVCGKVVEVEHCEADDIIHEYSKMDSSTTTVLVSLDADLQQCCKNGMFVHYWDILKRDWFGRDILEIYSKLFYKVIGGDTSDNIMGCSMLKRTSKMPEIKFKNGVIDGGKGTFDWVERQLKTWCVKNKADKITPDAFNFVHEQAQKEQDRNTYMRNYNLVNMDQRPAMLSEKIREAIIAAPINVPELTLADFGVSDMDAQLAQQRALADRESDKADGVTGEL